MDNLNINIKLNKLLIDTNFLLLESLQSKSNLFETLAVSHLEMWHSAFVKWLIDPNSNLGLGTFPLRRFLYTVAYQGKLKDWKQEGIQLELGTIENMQLENMTFENEYRYTDTDENKIGRIDIIGSNADLRIVIENKIKSSENEDQTLRYFEFFRKSTENYQYDLLIYLTPDEAQPPKSERFISITYQDLCDFVIKPCIENPVIKEESLFLLKQYLSNLGKPLKGGRVMALPNKDICEKIYEAHKDVLDEIFLSIKGEAPEGIRKRDKITTFNTTLTQMIKNGVLHMEDTLFAQYKGQEYLASLVDDNETIKIKVNDEWYGSPSAAAAAITKTSVNGWDFWRVRNSGNVQGGTLGELRENIK